MKDKKDNNFIKSIILKNFKSIENLIITPNKLNIFIGEPNTGKSNILEALGTISALGHHSILREFLRMKNIRNLFFKGSLDRNIKTTIKFADDTEIKMNISYDEENQYQTHINNELKGIMSDNVPRSRDSFKEGMYGRTNISGRKRNTWSEGYYIRENDKLLRKIKYYKFRDFNPDEYKSETPIHEIIDLDERERRRQNYQKKLKLIKTLEPPIGKNIFQVLNNTERSRLAFRDLLSDFDMKMLIDEEDEEIKIIKEEEGIYYTIPLYSLADTIQSVLFYQTAILSNSNNILIFEEPEAHTFPFYTSMIGETIANDSNNQFFIATHNPYFLDAIYSKVKPEDLNIYLVRHIENKTQINAMDIEERRILFEDDIFMSLSHFENWPTTQD